MDKFKKQPGPRAKRRWPSFMTLLKPVGKDSFMNADNLHASMINY